MPLATGIASKAFCETLLSMGLKATIAKAMFWSGVARMLLSLSRLVMLFVLTRALEPADFGIYQSVLVVLAFITELPSIALGAAIVQRSNITENHLKTVLFSNIIFGVCSSAFLLGTANSISYFFHEEKLTPVLKLISILPLLTCLTSLSQSLLVKELKFKILGLSEFFAYIIGFVPTVLFLILAGFDYWSLVWAMLVERIVFGIILISMRPVKLRPVFRWRETKELLSFGLYNGLARVFGSIGNQSDALIVGGYFGTDQLGIYNRSYSLMSANVNLAAQTLDSVLFSAFSSAQKEEKRLLDAFYTTDRLISLVFLPLACFCFACSGELVWLLFGPKWSSVVPVFQALSLGIYFRVSYKASNQLLRSTGHIHRLVVATFLYLVVSVGAMLILSVYGTRGVAIGFVIGLVFQYAQLLVFVRKLVPEFKLSVLIGGNQAIWFCGFLCIMFSVLWPNFLLETHCVVRLLGKSTTLFAFFLLSLFHRQTKSDLLVLLRHFSKLVGKKWNPCV